MSVKFTISEATLVTSKSLVFERDNAKLKGPGLLEALEAFAVIVKPAVTVPICLYVYIVLQKR